MNKFNHAVKNSVSVIHVQILPSNLENGDDTLKPVALHYIEYCTYKRPKCR